MKKLSDQLREAIEKAGVSRYSISKQTGVSETTLCRFVSGERGISVDAMDAIGQYLGLSIVSQKKRSTK
jgi:transcriptional regulator with XRE-family HTH domain